MQTKVLVSLAGGLAEDDGNVVLVSQGQSLPALQLTNTYVRNDELCFQQGYTNLGKPVAAKGSAVEVSTSKAFLVGTGLAASSGQVTVSSSSASLVPASFFAQGSTVNVTSSSASFPAVILAHNFFIKVSSSSASLEAASQFGQFSYWKVLAFN